MPISIQELVDETIPENTVLIFGAGASVQCNAPSVSELIAAIGKRFAIEGSNLSLSDISGLAERKRNRVELITLLREKFQNAVAKGSLLNVPLYPWKSIYTTNYDELVEKAYQKINCNLSVFCSNFDFTVQRDPTACKLFKIHGTISKDSVDGQGARLILTDLDYDATQDYREALYDRLKNDMGPGSQVVIIGQSLADTHLKDLIQRAVAINQKAMSGGRITILLFEKDENRAQLFESRGIRVAFGGLDEFFAACAKKTPIGLGRNVTDGATDFPALLRPTTTDVQDEIDPTHANVSAIFNGWPASYSDVTRGLTFDRSWATEIASYFLNPEAVCGVLLGASGVGKTTAARQALLRLRGQGFSAWEHKGDYPIAVDQWAELAKQLKQTNRSGVLFVDEAHSHLYEVNELIDLLIAADCCSLKLLLVSTRNHWGPRVKTPNIFSYGKEYVLSQLNPQEIDRLLSLVDSSPELRELVEVGFGGFSRQERRRRLIDRCEADMFVCMRNIFASEKFDDIILREYSTLELASQDVYRLVAAMEHSGVRVHRQLILRVLGIEAGTVAGVLSRLTDIVHEYDVNSREGVYGWKVRHPVIAAIVTKYKFAEQDKMIELLSKVIAGISPTYDIEIRTIRELCNVESGLSNIPDKRVQNKLLRQMMSVAPGERVPRHRLIRNLIDLAEFEQAESEIRIFDKDFGRDGPVVRYRILLLIARATETKGLMREDRLVILEQARNLAVSAVQRYETNKNMLGTYCELGVETFRISGSLEVYDDAMDRLKKAEVQLADPDVTRLIVKYQRRISAQSMAIESTSFDEQLK